MHRIINLLTKTTFKNSFGNHSTWLPVRPAVTYVYTLPRLSIAEYLAHPIA
jgi:hypothetical protein